MPELLFQVVHSRAGFLLYSQRLGWSDLPSTNTPAYRAQRQWRRNISLCGLTVGPNKLQCYTTLGWKSLPGTNTLARESLRGKYHCTIDLLFYWFGISCMTTDSLCFYLQNRLIQTSQTGVQQYSDTSPFSIPCSSLSGPFGSDEEKSGYDIDSRSLMTVGMLLISSSRNTHPSSKSQPSRFES